MPQALTPGERVVAALLRPSLNPAAPPPGDWTALITAAHEHGVLPLLAARAARHGPNAGFAAAMRPAVAANTALELVRHREGRRLFSAFARAGVAPLLLKGTHLAYSLYDAPELRPRIDTDLLVRDDEFDALRGALSAAGYAAVPHVTGDVAFGQFQYSRTDESGARHTIDLHRRIANPLAFAGRLTYEELAADADALPALAPNARGPAPWRALILACVHRTAHHGTSSRLIWLYDIHLLAGRLSDPEWDGIVAAAARKGLAPVIAAGLTDAADAFATALPPDLIERLRAHYASADADVVAFLERPPSLLRVAASDWRRLRSWRDRVRFLREHLFPSPSYIRHRYGIRSTVALPFLYAHRIVFGLVAMLKA